MKHMIQPTLSESLCFCWLSMPIRKNMLPSPCPKASVQRVFDELQVAVHHLVVTMFFFLITMDHHVSRLYSVMFPWLLYLYIVIFYYILFSYIARISFKPKVCHLSHIYTYIYIIIYMCFNTVLGYQVLCVTWGGLFLVSIRRFRLPVTVVRCRGFQLWKSNLKSQRLGSLIWTFGAEHFEKAPCWLMIIGG